MDKIYDCGNMSSTDIGNVIAEKEKELSESISIQQTVDLEILEVSKKILDLQRAKKDLQISDSKAKHNVKQLSIQLRFLKSKFWSARNEGL